MLCNLQMALVGRQSAICSSDRYDQAGMIQCYLSQMKHLQDLVLRYKFDNLTGLMTKSDFQEKFHSSFQAFQNSDIPFGLAFIDVDGLHNVNRNQGYAAGDKLIKQVGDELLMHFEFSNVFRVSGDEFAVLLHAFGTSNDVDIKLSSIDSISFEVLQSTRYSSPKEMFDDADSRLTYQKLNRNNVHKRV